MSDDVRDPATPDDLPTTDVEGDDVEVVWLEVDDDAEVEDVDAALAAAHEEFGEDLDVWVDGQEYEPAVPVVAGLPSRVRRPRGETPAAPAPGAPQRPGPRAAAPPPCSG